ncbi:MAG TPA: helicase-related protein, partial [Beutenbergiaceae bacterium]|nr:helicase-related protein [Beutenbergiaceae bacterium]
NIPVPASPEENAIAQELEDTWLWPKNSSPSGSSLFPWTLAKAFLSSPAALAATINERMRRIADDPDSTQETRALTSLLDLTEQALATPSAKYVELTNYLEEIGVGRRSGRRVVVFAERVPTLRWLQENLIRDFKFNPDQVALLHGGLSDVEQQEIVESFKLESSPIRVLVTGDLASEGVNLHTQCHHLVHYDIPWSLIRIEQRNGRIDRYGQKHRPQITTLLLQPDTGRFAGDFRVLTSLVQREHQAHRALGDAASLIGTYNVRAEEDAILKVIQQRKAFDDVVAHPDQVQHQGGPTGLLARILQSASSGAGDAQVQVGDEQRGSLAGMFASDHEFLSHAVRDIYAIADADPPRGIGWVEHHNHHITTFSPPADLRQRLHVLPQSYLKARRVTESFNLATTPARGKQELEAARGPDSTSAWPEAHYLSPLHPVLDWAADRVLAGLERGTVYAVAGGVEHPTVLLQGTLSNARGQVIAATYQTVSFLTPKVPTVMVHASAQDACDSLRISQRNTGLAGAHDLQALIAPAVEAVENNLQFQIHAIEEQTTARVQAWQRRVRDWQEQATGLVQREALRQRRRTVEQEERLAQAMLPERRLVRPLVVVVPEGDQA